MNVLELFAGSRSVGKVAESMGHTVFSSDLIAFDGIHYPIDILNLDINKIPFIPDMIWASPPCTTYSIAAISHHRDGTKAKSDFAKVSDLIVKRTLEIVDHFGCIYYIENPVGMLRKMPFMKDRERATVTYCRYGDTRMKPTDIWSNNIASLFNPGGWRPLPMCYNGNRKCHHEAAPRGSKTGTQGLSGAYERSMIPERLCREVINSTEYSLLKNVA